MKAHSISPTAFACSPVLKWTAAARILAITLAFSLHLQAVSFAQKVAVPKADKPKAKAAETEPVVLSLDGDNQGESPVKAGPIQVQMTPKADGLVSISVESEFRRPALDARIRVTSSLVPEEPVLETGTQADERGTVICNVTKGLSYDLSVSEVKNGRVRVRVRPLREVLIILNDKNNIDQIPLMEPSTRTTDTKEPKAVIGAIIGPQSTKAYRFLARADGKIVVTVETERGALKPRLLLYRGEKSESASGTALSPAEAASPPANPPWKGGKGALRATEAPLSSSSDTRWRLIGSVKKDTWYLLLVYGREDWAVGLFNLDIRNFRSFIDDMEIAGKWFGEAAGDLGAAFVMALPPLGSHLPKIGRAYVDGQEDCLVGEMVNGNGPNSNVRLRRIDKDGNPDLDKDDKPCDLSDVVFYQQTLNGVEVSRGRAESLKSYERILFTILGKKVRRGDRFVVTDGRKKTTPQCPVDNLWRVQ